MVDLLRVGTIAATHGIRGEVKVFPTTDDINRFKGPENMYSGHWPGEAGAGSGRRQIF